MPRVHQVTPFLHVPDFEQALDLMTRVLRFEVKFLREEWRYAYLEWEGAGLRLLEERGRARAEPGVDARMTVYLDVADVDALYEELRPGLETLPEGDFWPPGDKKWGQRELHVRLPDGHWLALGQAALT